MKRIVGKRNQGIWTVRVHRIQHERTIGLGTGSTLKQAMEAAATAADSANDVNDATK